MGIALEEFAALLVGFHARGGTTEQMRRPFKYFVRRICEN